jgi:addiction module RelB/DinJ family antitoxin
MKTSVNIKMDEEVRDQAKSLFAKMGLDMTTAVNMFLITSIREKGIPFQVTSVSQSDDETRYEEFFAKKLRAAEEQERAGQMRSFDAFMNEVDNKYGRK